MEYGELATAGAGSGINRYVLGARVDLRVGVGVSVGFGERERTRDAGGTPSGVGWGWWYGSYVVIPGFWAGVGTSSGVVLPRRRGSDRERYPASFGGDAAVEISDLVGGWWGQCKGLEVLVWWKEGDGGGVANLEFWWDVSGGELLVEKGGRWWNGVVEAILEVRACKSYGRRVVIDR
jgi:hypothetical protein